MDDQGEIFSYLPPEIILNILSRIPIRTVFTCKCVCKSWLELLESPEFARSHLSKSVPGLLINHVIYTDDTEMTVFKIFEFEDSPEIERHGLHCKLVLELGIDNIFSVIYGSVILGINGSANGLLLLQHSSDQYVCNPITRKYIKLPNPEGIHRTGTVVTHGFGVSRLSNQYKVVRIFHDCLHDPCGDLILSIPKPACQVYTLGTGSWRSISIPCEMFLDYSFSSKGKLLNGSLHWLAEDLNGWWWISCFDLETEVFTKFRAPMGEDVGHLTDMVVLRDRLCLCDNSSETEISIHMMNGYGGDEESWNIEYVISCSPVFSGESNHVVYAVKAFANGDLLMMSSAYHPIIGYYSNKTNTMELVNDMFNGGHNRHLKEILFTPSFVSLKGFETETVKVLELVCVVTRGSGL